MKNIKQPKSSPAVFRVDTQRARLCGYRQLSIAPPASVLPVFFDDSPLPSNHFLYQEIADNGDIAGFVADPELNADRLQHASTNEEITVVGEPALFAYEIDVDEVIFAKEAQMHKILKSFLQSGRLSNFPFAALEIAHFVKDTKSEEVFAARCAQTLSKHSHNLAKSWVATAQLSEAARKFAIAATDEDDSKSQWHRVKDILRDEVGEDTFSSWFSRVELDSIDGDEVNLSVPTRFLRSWIQSHYAEKVIKSWRTINADIKRVDLTVRTAAIRQATTAPESLHGFKPEEAAFYVDVAPAASQHEALGGSPLDARLNFDSFVVGRSNSLAHAAAMQVANARRGDQVIFNPLYIHAGVGLGKTHLLQAVTWACNAQTNNKALYLTAEKFMYGFVSALRTQTSLAFKDVLRGINVLVIDDMQFLQGKQTQAEFSHTLNSLIDAGRQVVIAADRPPGNLESLDERLRSRLAGGLVVEMGSLGEELRLEILNTRVTAARTHHAGFDVPQPVLSYIARSVTHNGRDLEGALNRLLAYSKLTGQPVTMELAEREVRDLIRPQDPRRTNIEEIQRIVARHYNVSRSDLLSSRRTANVVRPRQVAMYLAKTLTLRSLPEIGRRFGGLEHTTVLHAVRKIEQLASKDTSLADEIEALKRLLQE
jgi:chromosomal replication initiator protein